MGLYLTGICAVFAVGIYVCMEEYVLGRLCMVEVGMCWGGLRVLETDGPSYWLQ